MILWLVSKSKTSSQSQPIKHQNNSNFDIIIKISYTLIYALKKPLNLVLNLIKPTLLIESPKHFSSVNYDFFDIDSLSGVYFSNIHSNRGPKLVLLFVLNSKICHFFLDPNCPKPDILNTFLKKNILTL